MAVTIDQIKALRERTGAGLMTCKEALIETDGDVEKAIDVLREKGAIKAASKSGRVAAEGLTQVAVKGNKAAIVEVNCETDFVSASDKFHALVDSVLTLILEKEPSTIEELQKLCEPLLADATIAMGEKFVVRRFEIIEAKGEEAFGQYSHGQGKITALVLLSKDAGEYGKLYGMTIVSSAPNYLSEKDIPAEDLERETNVAKAEVANDPKLQGKPDAMKEKIVENKVKKTLGAQCLLNKPWVADENKTVETISKELGVSVLKFVRYQVGEGIEKKAE